ncbi:MAG: HesA/MoeB/ThiF family protein [Myxococcales bacterium]
MGTVKRSIKRPEARVLIIGVGGLGSPLALVLAHAGVRTLGLADDDLIERTNLHRQILFDDADVGLRKTDVARRKLEPLGVHVEVHQSRLLPHNALDLVSRYDLVVEGSDNYPTKFLAADACRLAEVPVVHGAAVRWVGTALAVGPLGGPCYRCLFEDLPEGGGPNCATAGVVGPVVGIVAAVQADLALALLDGQPVEGTLVTFDGKTDSLRRRSIAPRASCPLCGLERTLRSIERSRYVPADPCLP